MNKQIKTILYDGEGGMGRGDDDDNFKRVTEHINKFDEDDKHVWAPASNPISMW